MKTLRSESPADLPVPTARWAIIVSNYCNRIIASTVTIILPFCTCLLRPFLCTMPEAGIRPGMA